MPTDDGKTKAQYTFALAIIIISAYVVFLAVVMYQNQSNNYDGLKTVTATFGVIVAAVVGYYFGQRPTEAAEQRAQDAKKKEQESKAVLTQAIVKNVANITAGQGAYNQLLGVGKTLAQITGDEEYVKQILAALENLKKAEGA